MTKSFTLHYSKGGDYIEVISQHRPLETLAAVACDRVITHPTPEFPGFDDEYDSAIYIWDNHRTSLDNLINQFADHLEILASS